MSKEERETIEKLQRTIRDLERNVADLEAAHLGAVRFSLADTFPAFSELVHQLGRLQTACAPIASSTYDSRPSSKQKGNTWGTTPIDTGASTSADRVIAKDVNDTLRSTAARISDALSPKGKLHPDEHPHLPAPICWNPSCHAHRQGFDRLIENGGPGTCVSCGDEFTAHRPYDDKTLPADKRCRTRGCPKRDTVNQCIHSWQKMGITA